MIQTVILNIAVNSLLKIAPVRKNKISDNLIYEFYIGKELNNFLRTPNVLVTLNLYRFNDYRSLNKISISKPKLIDVNYLKKSLVTDFFS